MADHTYWTEVEVRQVYSLRTPTNWVEISKVLSALQQQLPADAYDDAVTVITYDEEIRFVVRPHVMKRGKQTCDTCGGDHWSGPDTLTLTAGMLRKVSE